MTFYTVDDTGRQRSVEIKVGNERIVHGRQQMLTDSKERTLYERAVALLADADVFGVAAVEDTRGTPLYDGATSLMPDARSIAVVGVEVFPEVVGLVEPQRQMGEVSANDLYPPHLDYLNGRLNRAIYDLAKVYRGAGYRALPLPSLGTPNDARFMRGILSFKHAGEYAGLGKIGRSSLLITPQFGPRARLACLLTNAEMPSTRRAIENPCASCPDLCVANCPAGALAAPAAGQPYAINKFACSTFRQAAGLCATCVSVCLAGAR